MIVLTRGVAGACVRLARLCLAGRPRGPAPPAACRVRGGALTVWVPGPHAGLLYAGPAEPGSADDLVVVPVPVLTASGGAGPVELTAARDKGEARWAGPAGPEARAFDAVRPGPAHDPPAPPTLAPVPAGFLRALHECGRTAAKDAGRLALDRVQVRGGAGQVVGTDGRTALVLGGFALPFADDMLVPAVPVFGSRDLARAGDAWVGRTGEHLVVAAGPWHVFLPAETAGRYPDVDRLIAADTPTTADIDPADAAGLLGALAGRSGAGGDPDRPATLDLSCVVTVHTRAYAPSTRDGGGGCG